MITKHCVRWSLSLCPPQAKVVAGVQGTVCAEPLTLVHGQDRLTLRFDCRPCEMHVVDRLRPHAQRDTARATAAAESPIRTYLHAPGQDPSARRMTRPAHGGWPAGRSWAMMLHRAMPARGSVHRC